MPSLLEALAQKYGDDSTNSEGSEDDEFSVSIFVPRKSPRTMVPSLLVLNDCDITTAGDQKALVDKCSGVEELDLAKNKLNYWQEVIGNLKKYSNLQIHLYEFSFLMLIFMMVLMLNIYCCYDKQIFILGVYSDIVGIHSDLLLFIQKYLVFIVDTWLRFLLLFSQ